MPNFKDLYGYGNLDSLLYFAIPSYILIKFNKISILKRLFYSMFIMSSYTLFKFFYQKDFREDLTEYKRYIKNISKE